MLMIPATRVLAPVLPPPQAGLAAYLVNTQVYGGGASIGERRAFLRTGQVGDEAEADGADTGLHAGLEAAFRNVEKLEESLKLGQPGGR